MTKPIPEHKLLAIEAVVFNHPEGIATADIALQLEQNTVRRTLQYHLKHLVDEGRLTKKGTRRWARYLPPIARALRERKVAEPSAEYLPGKMPISKQGAEIAEYVRQPLQSRKIVTYEHAFLNSYKPNYTAYLSNKERAHLREVGTEWPGKQAAGTHIKRILDEVIIDLSWNSSRLERNTYSLLDTKRLINFGEIAKNKEQFETRMILNHQEAIEFLVGSAEKIRFDRRTILNLHTALAKGLLDNPQAEGRLRSFQVTIAQSVFSPLGMPQLIEEYFDQILATADAITDPFEQAFFVMVQLPYLQPFDDVNKRVSRLAANIPFIKTNLSPLSFAEVPLETYIDAILGVYELNRIDLLKDVFIWAYERSASRYVAVRQTLGEPKPFETKHRIALREIIHTVLIERLGRKEAFARVAAWVRKNVAPDEQEQFRQVVEIQLMALHEGNFMYYRVNFSQFSAWQDAWNQPLTYSISQL